jgi:2-phosphoglycolate phosphatase
MKKLNHPLQAVFFDLDGTLIDTAPDLSFAIDETLNQFGRKPIPFQELRQHLNSTQAILQLGFQIDESDSSYPSIQKTFLSLYLENLTRETLLFPGMEQVLDYLDLQKISWGIVTNKPFILTEPILKHFKLLERSSCVIAGDTLAVRKPHPDPLLHACKLSNISPENAVYVGDNEIDILTAKAAGIFSIGVQYGYHALSNPPEKWDADLLVASSDELMSWLASDKDLVST